MRGHFTPLVTPTRNELEAEGTAGMDDRRNDSTVARLGYAG
jgi:hypothetical protein